MRCGVMVKPARVSVVTRFLTLEVTNARSLSLSLQPQELLAWVRGSLFLKSPLRHVLWTLLERKCSASRLVGVTVHGSPLLLCPQVPSLTYPQVTRSWLVPFLSPVTRGNREGWVLPPKRRVVGRSGLTTRCIYVLSPCYC